MDRAGLALATLLIVVVWVLVYAGILTECRRAADLALQANATLARPLEAEVAGRLRTIEALLRFGGALHARDPSGFTVRGWTGIDPMADIVQAAIIGPDGRIRLDEDGVPPAPVDLRDRPHIAAILADPSYDRLEIGRPLYDPRSGRHSIALARPLRDAAGDFVGIIQVAVDSDSFSRLYRQLDLQGRIVGLVGSDGILRARVPGPDTVLGLRFSDATIARLHTIEDEAHRRSPSVIDGVDRFFLYRRVRGYPLFVTVGIEADTVLARPRQESIQLLATGGILTLLILGLCLAVAHQRRRDQHLRAQLEAVVGHIGQGIMMIGPDRRLAVVNRRAVEMLDLPPGLTLPGTPIGTIVAWQEQAGEFGGGPAPHTHLDGFCGPDRPPVVTQRTRPDGTRLEIRTAYVGDGSHVRTFTDITAAHRSAAAIAAARDRALAAEAALVAALEHAPHGVMLTGPDERILLCNQAAIDLIGIPAELARPGTPITDLIAHQAANGEIPPITGSVAEAWAAMRVQAQSLAGSNRERVKPDGRVIEVRSSFLDDGRFIRTYTDVTAHHAALRAEAALRDQAEVARAALAAAFENAPFGIALFDAAGRIEVVNSLTCSLLDLPPTLIRPGTDIRHIVQTQVARGDFAANPETWRLAATTLQRGMLEHPPYVRTTPQGRMLEVRVRFLPDGRSVRTVTDVTARQALLQAQETARLAAEAALRSRTEFLAIVSHELRTPLNAVIGLADLLLLHQPRPDQVPDLQTMRDSGQRLLGLVDDILDISRLERGRVTLRETRFDPHATLCAMAGLIAPRALAKGLDFALDVDADLPQAVLGDEERLRQVLLKLLDNAVKFTPAGRITFGAMARPAAAAPGSTGDEATGSEAGGGWRLTVTVADTGIGITPELEARLFEPFAQGDSSTARPFGGLGLGLAVCRLLLENMGGTIAVESAAGAGSVFRVELPLRRPPQELAADAGHARAGHAIADAGGGG